MNKIDRYNKLAPKAKSKSSEIMKKLNITEGDNILEIGVGGGYYADLFSDLIGKKGMYYGADTDEEFLNNLKQLNQHKENKNITPKKVGEHNLPVTEKKVNLIFTRNVYHHLSNRTNYFKHLASLLAENGKIAIIDYNNRWSLMKLSGHYTKPETVISEMQDAGYILKEEHTI